MRERGKEAAEAEKKRKDQEEREKTREWMRSQWDTWRAEGKAFEFDVEIKEEDAQKTGYAIGLSFQPMTSPPRVAGVKAGSIASRLKIGEGDLMVGVNEKNVTSMPTDLAVRTLTLAEWPRTLYFSVPERVI